MDRPEIIRGQLSASSFFAWGHDKRQAVERLATLWYVIRSLTALSRISNTIAAANVTRGNPAMYFMSGRLLERVKVSSSAANVHPGITEKARIFPGFPGYGV